MHPLLVAFLLVIFAFLFLMSLRLGVTGAGLFILLCLGGYGAYRLGATLERPNGPDDHQEDGDDDKGGNGSGGAPLG